MQVLLDALVLGLVGGVIPGAVLSMLLVSVMQGGFKSGFKTYVSCVFAEVIIVMSLLLIVLSLPLPETFFSYIGLLGSVVLLYFAWQVSKLSKIDNPEKSGEIFTFKSVFILSLTNAPLYIFWATVCVPLILQLSNTIGLVSASAFYMLAFEIGWALSTAMLLVVFVKAKKLLSDARKMKWVFVGVASLMVLLSLRVLLFSLQDLNIF